MHPYLIFISVFDTIMSKMLIAYKHFKTPNYHLHILGEESSADCRQFLNSSRSEDRILPIFKVPSLGRAFNTKPVVRTEGKSHGSLTPALHSTFGPRGSARSLRSASPKKYESYQIHRNNHKLWYGVTLGCAPATQEDQVAYSIVSLSVLLYVGQKLVSWGIIPCHCVFFFFFYCLCTFGSLYVMWT